MLCEVRVITEYWTFLGGDAYSVGSSGNDGHAHAQAGEALYFCDRFRSENDRSDHLAYKSGRQVPDKI